MCERIVDYQAEGNEASGQLRNVPREDATDLLDDQENKFKKSVLEEVAQVHYTH